MVDHYKPCKSLISVVVVNKYNSSKNYEKHAKQVLQDSFFCLTNILLLSLETASHF